MASGTRSKVEFRKVTKAIDGGKIDDDFHPPPGVTIRHNPDAPTEFKVQIDGDTAFTSVSEGGGPNIRDEVHYGGGDDGAVYPDRKRAKVICEGAYAGAVLEVDIDVGAKYGKYKLGDEGAEVSLQIKIVQGWQEVVEKKGFSHRNICKMTGKVSIGNEKDGMYATQSPFSALARDDKGQWDNKNMNVVKIVRHLVILLENPYMVNCG